MALDVLRGFAMVLVVLQHSYFSIDLGRVPSLLDLAIWRVTDLAAVAFLAISGTLLACHLGGGPAERSSAQRRYVRRALFLLVAGHFLLALFSFPSRLVRDPVPPLAHTLALLAASGMQAPADHWIVSLIERFVLYFPITDTIAVCMLIAPRLITRLGTRTRLALVVVLLALSPVIRALADPSNLLLSFAAEALFGALGEARLFWFPLAPWLAVFLAGSVPGLALARLRPGRTEAAVFVKTLRAWGWWLTACSVLLTALYKVLKIGLADRWGLDLFRALYPGQTTTFLPAYLAVLSWLLAFLVERLDQSGALRRICWPLIVLGRTSLFAYVAQYAVVLSLPAALGVTGKLGVRGFLTLFATGLLIVWSLSYCYGHLRGWFVRED